MINKLILTIIKIIVNILSFILNILFLPLTAVMDSMFPNLQDHATNFNYLCNNYIFNGIRFMREVIYNFTGLNRDLTGILFALPLIYFGFFITNQRCKIINFYL